MTSFSSKALLLLLGFWLVTFGVFAQAPALGTFYDFNVVGSQRVVNTENTNTVVRSKVASVDQDAVGLSPESVWRGIENRNAIAQQARQDARAAYSAALLVPVTSTLTNADLGNRTYTPGVYQLNGPGSITGDITLDGGNNANSVFIFIIKGSLSASAGVNLKLIRDAKIANVLWVIENELTVGNSAELKGNFLVTNHATLGDGATVRGRVASLQGEVRLNNNNFFLPTDLEIKIQKSEGNAGVDKYIVGQSITYTFTATNKGPVDDANVRVTPIIFTGNNYTSSIGAPEFSFVNGNWVWNIGRLNVGESRTLTITAVISETGPGFVRGTILGAEEDELQLNNTVDINFCAVLPDAGVITGPAELCVGTVGEYKIEQVVGATGYTWNVPSGWRIISGQGTTTIKVEAVNRNDDAFIQVSVNNSCGASPPSRLKVNNFPDPPAKPGPITAHEGICAGEGASYSIAPVKDATKYNWTVPEGWSISGGQGTTRITVVVGTTAGKVTVTAENVCGISAPTELDVEPFLQQPSLPSAISGSGTLPFCYTQDRLTFSVTASGDVKEYVWEMPAEWEVIEGQGKATIVVNPHGVGGVIKVKGLNDCGQSGYREFLVVPLPGPPANPGDISGSFPVCQNTIGTKYSIAPVPGASSYTWYVPDGWTITAGQGTTEITVTLSEDAKGGQIRVQAENACGASGITRKDVTTTTAAPVMPLVIRGEQFGCATRTTTYETDPVAGAQTYIWNVPSGWTIKSGQGTTRIEVVIGDQAGNVTVYASNSCGQSEPKVFPVRPFTTVPPTPFAIKGPNEVCVGQLEAEYSLDPVDHTLEYIWALPEGWSIISGQGTTNIKVKVGTKAGDITVTASNPCGNSSQSKLPVAPVPNVPAPQPGAITGIAQYCAGLNQEYSIAPVEGASSYFWTFPGADWKIVSGQGTTKVIVTAGTTPGQVTVATVNKCGNRSTATGLTVRSVGSVPPSPAAIISENEAYCGNATGLIFRTSAVPTALSYTWTVPAGWTITEGQGTTQIKATASTSGGEVTVKAVNSCGESQSIKILTEPQRPLMNPEAIKGPAVPCLGRTDVVYSIPAISGAESYLWTLPAGWAILEGEFTNSIRVSVGRTDGPIKVKARNACGETAEISLNAKVVTAGPFPPAAINGNVLTCATRTATYSIAEVATAATYNWTVPTGWEILSGQGTTQITVQVGTLSGEVKVNSENDCGKSADIALAVTAAPLPTVSQIVDRTIACSDVATFELETSSAASTYTWFVPEGWQILSGQGTTTITVQQGNAKGEVKVVANDGQCDSDPAVLYSDPSLRKAELTLPNVFSPNNDGNNDTWEIGNLLNYADNDLVVVNRWGNEVYKSKSYKNNWNGDKLAEGTYYYVLRVTLCDGTEKMYKGYVMIVR